MFFKVINKQFNLIYCEKMVEMVMNKIKYLAL